jgi:hypothetical protein
MNTNATKDISERIVKAGRELYAWFSEGNQRKHQRQNPRHRHVSD